jgi:DNA-binding response OmpR family regulator
MNQKILIAEDDVVFCKLLTRFLSKNEYQVMDAQNGTDALELLELNGFALAILDYNLLDMNGIDILKKIKAKSIDTRVILITRYGDEEVEKEANDAGADAFVSKPINPEELLELIQGMNLEMSL